MSKEKMKGILEKIAQAQENVIDVYKETNGLFCGYSDSYKIHISQDRWDEVINAIQPVVTYNPNWDKRFNNVEAYFYMDLCGKKYKVFALLDKGAV